LLVRRAAEYSAFNACLRHITPPDIVLTEIRSKEAWQLMESDPNYVRLYSKDGWSAGYRPSCGRTLLSLMNVALPTEIFTEQLFLGGRQSPNGKSWVVAIFARYNMNLPDGVSALSVPPPSLISGLQVRTWQSASPLSLKWAGRVLFHAAAADPADPSRIVLYCDYVAGKGGRLAPIRLDVCVTDDGRLVWQSDTAAIPELLPQPDNVLAPSD
jgi:hypothetical protein